MGTRKPRLAASGKLSVKLFTPGSMNTLVLQSSYAFFCKMSSRVYRFIFILVFDTPSHIPATSVRGVVSMCCIMFKTLLFMQLAVGSWSLLFGSSTSSECPAVCKPQLLFRSSFSSLDRPAVDLHATAEQNVQSQNHKVPTKQLRQEGKKHPGQSCSLRAILPPQHARPMVDKFTETRKREHEAMQRP